MVFERKQLGKFLRQRRNSLGLSQSAVSKQLGYSSPQFVSNWERGISSPPLKALSTLVKIYQIPGNELVDVILKETKEILWRELESKQATSLESANETEVKVGGLIESPTSNASGDYKSMNG